MKTPAVLRTLWANNRRVLKDSDANWLLAVRLRQAVEAERERLAIVVGVYGGN